MFVQELINALEHYKKTEGNLKVTINAGAASKTSEELFVVMEDYPDHGKEIQIRDWPY